MLGAFCVLGTGASLGEPRQLRYGQLVVCCVLVLIHAGSSVGSSGTPFEQHMAVFHAGDLTGGITALDALEQYAERGTSAGIGLMLYRRQAWE